MRVSDNSMDRTALRLMDDLWQKRYNSGQSSAVDDFKPNTLDLKAISAKPDWDCIPSKDVAMSEEEFEKAIKDLALKAAEKGMALGNAGEGRAAYRLEEAKLMAKYISTVSPDRKTAYENYKGSGNTIYGDSNKELMVYSNGTWSAKLTSEELSKSAKFYETYNNAIKEYEAKNGQIPSNGSKTSNPYNDLLAEYRAYSFLNALA
jgi:hypothetical protein